eukprot:SAG11_NODE_2053_length_3878_cov_2.361207_4_plen_90_part_00
MRRLVAEVQRKSKPLLYDVELPEPSPAVEAALEGMDEIEAIGNTMRSPRETSSKDDEDEDEGEENENYDDGDEDFDSRAGLTRLSYDET